MFSLKRLSLTLAALACAGLAVTCSKSDGGGGNTNADAGTDGGQQTGDILPPTIQEVGVESTVLADDKRIIVSWVFVEPDDLKGKIAHWRVDWAADGKFPGKHSDPLLASDARQYIVTDVEQGKKYQVFVSGLDASGAVLKSGATKKVQTQALEVTTQTGAFRGPFRATTTKDTDNPLLMTFNNGTLVLMYRADNNYKTLVSHNRGASFAPAGDLTKSSPSGLSIAWNPDTGKAAACYMNSLGLRVAVSEDSAANWSESVVWDYPPGPATGGAADETDAGTDTDAGVVDDAGTPVATDMEQSNCGVTILRDGTLLLVSDAKNADGAYVVRVRRSTRGDDGTLTWSSPVEIPRADGGEVAVVVDPKLRGPNGDKEMVYIAFVTRSATGDQDVQFAASEDGGQNWRTVTTANASWTGGPKAGTVLRLEDDTVRKGDQIAPTMAVDPVTGRVWVAVETKTFTGAESVLLATSDDFMATSPAGSATSWSVGKQFVDGGGLVRGPHIRTEDRKLLIAFAATQTSDSVGKTRFLPYLTRFDADARNGQGAFEAPQSNAAVDMVLAQDAFIAADQTSGALGYNGPAIVGDGVISRFVAWTGDPNVPNLPKKGNILVVISP